MSARFGVGIVGLGNSGWYYHAEGTIEGSEDFDVVAVSARTPDRTDAGAKRFNASAHLDWSDLVRDPAVDVVVVAAPHNLHCAVSMAALDAGKHVVVEKPMAMTVSETEAMRAAARRNARLLTVFHNRRWEPTFVAIRDMVASGLIGEAWRVEERRMHAGKYTVAGPSRAHAGSRLAEWAHRPDGGGGVSYLIAPHLIDHQLVLHGDRPETVSAQMHTYSGDAVEHYLDLRMTFPGDRLSRVEIFRENAVDLPKWTVLGSKGTIICPDFTSIRVELETGETREYSGLQQLQACDEFYEALARGLRGDGSAPVDPDEAAQVVGVLEAAHRSARDGGRVISLPEPA